MLVLVQKITYKDTFHQTSGMAPWAKALAAKSDNLSSVTIIHIKIEENLLPEVDLHKCTVATIHIINTQELKKKYFSELLNATYLPFIVILRQFFFITF